MQTTEKPGDDAIRGINNGCYADQCWFKGPDLLRELKHWPPEEQLSNENKRSTDNIEARKKYVHNTTALINYSPTSGKLSG